MKYIVKKLQSRLAILRRLLVAFTTIATIHAQSITLKDTKGRAIEILIDSASETEVAGRRKGDNKKVSIKTETLDAESRKAVETWRKTTGRIPSQQFEVKLKHGDNHEFTVKFKMPVANYNTSIDHSSMINLRFDIPRPKGEPLTGKFFLHVYPTEKKAKEGLELILKEINDEIKDHLSTMSPTQRQEVEASAHPTAISHGEFSGYRCAYSAKNYVRTTNGKYMIYASLREVISTDPFEAPVTQEDVIKILKTIEITKGH